MCFAVLTALQLAAFGQAGGQAVINRDQIVSIIRVDMGSWSGTAVRTRDGSVVYVSEPPDQVLRTRCW